MTRQDYKKRQIAYQEQIIKELTEGIGDKDIQNLTDIMYSIMPDSYWYRWGYIKSLRKAIKALEYYKREVNPNV